MIARFAAVIVFVVDDHNRRGSRSHRNDCRRNDCRRSRLRRRRQRTAVEIRCPCRRNRTVSASTPFPGAVIPVPILITGNPGAFPPVVTVFGDHHSGGGDDDRLLGDNDRSRFSDNDRLLGDNDRSRFSDNIALFRREEDVIEITEKHIDPAGILTVIDVPSRDMSAVTGASGEDAPG